MGAENLMSLSFDVERARRETRGCEKLIHFNNAGASLPPITVADSLYHYLREEEEQGGYEVMARRADEIENFYTASARLLNCTTQEIAFADSATRAWNSLFYAFTFKPGERVLVGTAEYGSSLVALLHRIQLTGVEIVQIPDDKYGQIDISALKKLIDDRVKLICVTHIPSGGGLINPVAAVGKVARAAEIPYLLDACQALGHLPVDVEEIGCDMLCGTGRKFLRGPRGTGLLYLRKNLLETLEPSQLNHHAASLASIDHFELRPDARRFECWERSYAGQLALGVAIDYALEWGLGAISERVCGLAQTMRCELVAVDGMTLADKGLEQCGIVTFSSSQLPADKLCSELAARRINTSTVPFNANPISSTLSPHPPLLRASLHYYNTVEEIDQFIAALKSIC